MFISNKINIASPKSNNKRELENRIEETGLLLDKTERELALQSDILKTIFANTELLMAYLDENFRFVAVNKAFAVKGGYPEEYYAGKYYFDLFQNDRLKALFEAVRNTGKTCTENAFPSAKKDETTGEFSYWDLNLQPLKTGETITGFILILREVTARKKTEEQLLIAEKALVEAKRMSDLGTLAATVAHEIRNPLNVIRTAVFNIRRKNGDPNLENHIRSIERKVSDGEQIVNNLLNYTKIKEPERKSLELYSLLEECAASTEDLFSGSGIHLVRNFGDLKNIRIEADPVQIREVILNILGNAFQAVNGEGRVEIYGVITGEAAAIVFRDNGEGIAEEDMERIFDPFFSKKHRGTGLGLTICRELLDLHGGRIDVSSVRGIGTEVTVNIPLSVSKS